MHVPLLTSYAILCMYVAAYKTCTASHLMAGWRRSFPLVCVADWRTTSMHSFVKPSILCCPILPELCRYEDLKQQLLAAQNLAEQEGDQQELARAAAAVARLTFPSSGAVDTASRPALVIAARASCCWAVMMIWSITTFTSKPMPKVWYICYTVMTPMCCAGHTRSITTPRQQW